MSVRDSLARRFSGGPRFRVRPDQMLVEVGVDGSRLDDLEEGLEELPTPDILASVRAELNSLGFEVKELGNFGVLKVTADRLTDVLDSIFDAANTFSDEIVSRLTKLRERAKDRTSRTIVGGYGVGELVHGQSMDSEPEARIRNALSDISLKNELTQAIEDIQNVVNAEMVYTKTTFGPRNLRVDPDQLRSLTPNIVDGNIVFDDEEDEELSTLDDVRDTLGVEDVWDEYTGDDIVVAVFDTAYCEDFFDDSRIIDTFHGDDVDSAFSDDSAEGHGTMTAVSTAGNTDDGAPFDGMAPDADLLLARVTDADGALSYVEDAWDWLATKLDEIDRVVVSNHSYGVPLCSARPMSLCDATATKVAKSAAERDNHIAVYAAGNEATYCGHRLSGVTNGIAGVNSTDSVISVGALRASGEAMQEYSSHGFGTCSDEDIKPNISAPIPASLPYACEVKDMSTGSGGSSGGTSTASPVTAGVVALLAEEIGEGDTELVKEALQETATLPRTTQFNVLRGYDARFGYGRVEPEEALEYIREQQSS